MTVAFNQAAAFVDVRVLEYSGLDTASPLDVTAGAVGTGGTPSSGAATTKSAKELIFGAGMTGGHFSASRSRIHLRIITSPDGDIAEDKIVSATGSYSAVGASKLLLRMDHADGDVPCSGQGTGNPAPIVSSIAPPAELRTAELPLRSPAPDSCPAPR